MMVYLKDDVCSNCLKSKVITPFVIIDQVAKNVELIIKERL